MSTRLARSCAEGVAQDAGTGVASWPRIGALPGASALAWGWAPDGGLAKAIGWANDGTDKAMGVP